MSKYYVTSRGLAAAFTDPAILNTLTDLLHGENDIDPQSLLAQGLIAAERRDQPHVSHNLLIVSGAVGRLRAVLNGGMSAPTAHVSPAPARSTDLRTVPRKLYRLTSAVTPATLRGLPSAARHVHDALQRLDVGTVRSLADATGLNRRTVENGISALRKIGAIEDVALPRETF